MYDKNNVFAQIIEGKISANIVYEDEYLISFHDSNPVAQIHVLILPKGQYINYCDFIQKSSQIECLHFFHKLNDIAKQLNISHKFRLISNNGSGQSVPHFHVHLIAGQIFD